MHKTVYEILTGRARPMSLTEFDYWISYRQYYGLDNDRIVYAVANAGSAQCHAWGSKVKPDDIVPQFGRARSPSKKKLLFHLASLPGATVEFTPKDPTRPKLTGDAAMAELDKHDDYRPGRLLNEGPKPELPKARRTLGGD